MIIRQVTILKAFNPYYPVGMVLDLECSDQTGIPVVATWATMFNDSDMSSYLNIEAFVAP